MLSQWVYKHWICCNNKRFNLIELSINMRLLYDPFLNQKPRFQNIKFFLDNFFVSSYFASHKITVYLSKYLRDGCMGRPLNSNFGGTVTPVPSKSPPMAMDASCCYSPTNINAFFCTNHYVIAYIST